MVSVFRQMGVFLPMDQQLQVIVRRSVRYDVGIRGSVAIAADHAQLVRFGGGAGTREGWLDVDVVDFSSSGMGMMSQVFIPRRSLLLVRAYGYGPGAPVIVEVPVRVQRVCMTDRRPAYLIGTAFADPPPKSIEQINALLRLLEGEDEPARTSGPVDGPSASER
jgi:hypothetical protein